MAQHYEEAIEIYEQCCPLSMFKSDSVVLSSNIAQCLIKLGLFERALLYVHAGLKQAKACDVSNEVLRKLKFRLALILLELRDYQTAQKLLKQLKLICYEQGDESGGKACQDLLELTSKRSN